MISDLLPGILPGQKISDPTICEIVLLILPHGLSTDLLVHLARDGLHLRCSYPSRPIKVSQDFSDLLSADGLVDEETEPLAIFNRLRSPLPLVWYHGVSRIPDKNQPSFGVGGQRVVVPQFPKLDVLRLPGRTNTVVSSQA